MNYWWLIFLMILTGCGVQVPDSRLGAVASEVPGRWAASREAKAGIDTNWVSRIGGRRAVALVNEALSANADIRIAAERVRRAEAVAKTEGSRRNPQVTAGLDGNRAKQLFVGFPFGDGGIPSSISNTFGSNLQVAWEPDIWGFRRAGQEALIASAQAEGYAFRAARASLAGQVMRAWLAAAEANEQIALLMKSEKLLKTTLEIVRDRFISALSEEGGSAAQFRLAESEVASNEAMIAQWQGELARSVRELELLLGRYPKGIAESARTLPKVPPRPPVGLPSELLLRRPDILEAERRFASTGSFLKQGKLAFFPSFNITARTGTTTDAFRQVLNSDFGVWSLAGSLAQPIWAGGALRSEYSRLKSDERSALAQLQKTVLAAFGEVEQALVAGEYLAGREQGLQKGFSSAEEATRAAQENYAGGTGDALTLINSQSTQITLGQQLVTVARLRLENRVTLHLALGGDYRIGK